MINTKKYVCKFGGTLFFLAFAALFTCETVPDYCTSGEVYDPKCQFCFSGAAYNMCGGKTYNPLTEGCAQNTVGTRCQDETAVPTGTPCGGYALSTASTPASGGKVTRTPDKPNYAAKERVVLTADMAKGYKFAGWAGAEKSTARTITITMNANAPLVAMFEPIDLPGAATHTLITTAFPEYGGTITRNPNAATYNNGTTVTLTATAAQGYTFNGWSGTEAPATSPANIKMDKNKTLVAMFTPTAHTLAIVANPADGGAVFVNGSALKAAAPQEVGPEIVAWAMPADGYTFSHWSVAGTTTVTNNPATINITNSNMTLTANFQSGGNGRPVTPPPVICTLKTLATQDGGSVSRSPIGTTYRIGTRVTLTATKKNGYAFTGWDGAEVSGRTTDTVVTIMMDGHKTVTANFQWQGSTPKQYLVTVSSAGTGMTGNGLYEVDASVDITAGLPPNNYRFKHWTTESNGVVFANADNEATTFIMPANNVTVTAVFELLPGIDSSTISQYLVTISAGTGATGGGSHEKNTTVTISAGTVPDGQRFKNWTTTSNGVVFDDSSKVSTTFIMPANDVTVIAVFEVIKYAVTVSSDGIGAEGNGHYEPNTLVNITAGTPPDGQRFKNWMTTDGVIFGNVNNASTSFIMPTKAVTVTAVFVSIYKVTVSAGTDATGGGNYAAGDTVRITAGTPPNGQRFTNWMTTDGVIFGNANNASTSFIMPKKAVTVTAVFVVIPPSTYAVTVSAGDGATGGGNYAAGTKVTITAGTAPAGQQFKNWISTSNGVTFANADSTTTTFTMPANAVMVTANFELIVIIPPENKDSTFTDVRDGKIYKKVKIGNQIWMAENLNYQTVGTSYCYYNSDLNCVKYGRLYGWFTATMVCPSGWHLPSRKEWDDLITEAGGWKTAGIKLQSKSGWDWDNYGDVNNKGTDDYGFSALPGGFRSGTHTDSFDHVGMYGYWWTATESTRGNAYFQGIYPNGNVIEESNNQGSGFSVRCVQDDVRQFGE